MHGPVAHTKDTPGLFSRVLSIHICIHMYIDIRDIYVHIDIHVLMYVYVYVCLCYIYEHIQIHTGKRVYG